ncbi:Manganese transport system membrane protein MntC [Thermoflexales bacterium]|nr:Manganese transport system membrane protein MntC [Thermoflexales bacterium]
MNLFDLFSDYTLRTVALGAGVLGLVSGALGGYAVLRKQALLGDAVSHAALPGIALAFMLTGSKAPLVLVLGAAIAGWLATLLVISIVKTTRIKDDSALGLLLSVFFGFGLMLLTFIQRTPDAAKAGLDKFLFGQAATLLASDVLTMSVLGLIVLALVALLWKEFKLLTFDPAFGASLGFRMRFLDVALTTLIVVAIVVGLQTVGVVLMSAMIVAPASAARQWTDRLAVMIGLAGLFGALAGVSGAVISSSTTQLPTGPTIVLSISVLVFFSLCLAPNRGLVWSWARRQRNKRQLRVDSVLGDLFTLAQQHRDANHAHSISVLRAMNAGRGGVKRSLDEMRRLGWVQQVNGHEYALTQLGRAEAEKKMSQSEV